MSACGTSTTEVEKAGLDDHIWGMIFDHLELGDLHGVRRTCKAFNAWSFERAMPNGRAYLAGNGNPCRLQAALALRRMVRAPARERVAAIRCGHLDALRLLDSDAPPTRKMRKKECHEAALHGHLHILRHVLDGWNDRREGRHETFFGSSLVERAASRGHLAVVRHLVEERSHPVEEPWGCIAAAQAPDAAVLRYLHTERGMALEPCAESPAFMLARRRPYLVTPTGARLEEFGAVSSAALAGSVGCLAYLHENRVPMDSRACHMAISKDRLEALRYLRAIGVPWVWWMYEIAVREGSLECLCHMVKNDCPMGPFLADPARYALCEYATVAGEVTCVRYLHEEVGLPLSVGLLRLALSLGRTECARYITAKGLDIDPTQARFCALRSGHVASLRFVREAYGVVFDSACQYGDVLCSVDCVRYLHESGCPWDDTVWQAILRSASWQMPFRIYPVRSTALYAWEQGCPMSPATKSAWVAFCDAHPPFKTEVAEIYDAIVDSPGGREPT